MSQSELSTRSELKSKLVNLCAFVASDECEPWQRGFLLDEITAIHRTLQATDPLTFGRDSAQILGCHLPGPRLAVA